MTHYAHWRDVSDDAWRWPNFSPAEISCRGTGQLVVNAPALDVLQALRDGLKKPVIVTSGYRTPKHNLEVGGAPNSEHLQGAAFDVAMINHEPRAFEAAARDVGFRGFGFYPRSNFIHVDVGRLRDWGTRFPRSVASFPREPAWLRENLVESRTLVGCGVTGSATVGGAGFEIVQSAIAEAETKIGALIPYVGALRWVFVVVALAGTGWAIYARLDDWNRKRR